MRSEFFIDLHAAAPTVVDHHRVVGILPGFGVAEHLTDPRPQHVGRTIRPAGEGANEDGRRVKCSPDCKRVLNGAGFGFNPADPCSD